MKKTIFTVLGVMLAVIVASITLVFTVGPMVSADSNVIVVEDEIYFEILNGGDLAGLSWKGKSYVANKWLKDYRDSTNNLFVLKIPERVKHINGKGGHSFLFTGTGPDNVLIFAEESGTDVDFVDNFNWVFDQIILPSTLEEIGDFAFANISIDSITIPASVTTVGEHIFGDIGYLRKIIVQSEDLYNDPNLAEYKNADMLELVVPSQNENDNENQGNETPSMINEENKAGVVAAVAGTTGGVAGLGTIGTILGVVISKKRKNS